MCYFSIWTPLIYILLYTCVLTSRQVVCFSVAKTATVQATVITKEHCSNAICRCVSEFQERKGWNFCGKPYDFFYFLVFWKWHIVVYSEFVTHFRVRNACNSSKILIYLCSSVLILMTRCDSYDSIMWNAPKSIVLWLNSTKQCQEAHFCRFCSVMKKCYRSGALDVHAWPTRWS